MPSAQLCADLFNHSGIQLNDSECFHLPCFFLLNDKLNKYDVLLREGFKKRLLFSWNFPWRAVRWHFARDPYSHNPMPGYGIGCRTTS